MGMTVSPSASNSIATTPDCGFLVQSAPHSAILPPCQAGPAAKPREIGSAAIGALSVVRPQITIIRTGVRGCLHLFHLGQRHDIGATRDPFGVNIRRIGQRCDPPVFPGPRDRTGVLRRPQHR